jgi:hypothetical protein
MKMFMSLPLSLAISCTAAMAQAQISPVALARASSEQLRDAYLECECISSHQRISLDGMALCAAVSDTLLQRDFDGVLDRQLAWWRTSRRAPDAATGCKPSGSSHSGGVKQPTEATAHVDAF